MMNKIFDSNNHSGWLIIATLVVVVGGFVTFFMPMFYAMGRFQVNTKVGYAPSEASLYYQLVGVFLLALGLYFIYKLDGVVKRLISITAGVALFIVATIFSFQSYTYVDENFIEFGEGYKVNTYTYDQIKELYYDRDENTSWFILVMDDGKEYEVAFGGLISTGSQNHIRRTVEANGIKMVDIS
jgi:hypothetical protein